MEARTKRKLLRLLVAVVVVTVAAWAERGRDAEPTTAPGRSELRTHLDDIAVVSHGDVVYHGPIDLTATIARIQAGGRDAHDNDGSVFGNRERRLPAKPRDYYREYVHPTDGIRGAGPQRIVTGSGGEWYYTPDHYNTFVPLN